MGWETVKPSASRNTLVTEHHHKYSGNKSDSTALFHAGDVGEVPALAKQHLYLNNEAQGRSTMLAGNCSVEALKAVMERRT